MICLKFNKLLQISNHVMKMEYKTLVLITLLFAGINSMAQKQMVTVPTDKGQLGVAGQWGGTDVGSGLTYTWVQDAFSTEFGETNGMTWEDNNGQTIYKQTDIPAEYIGGMEALNEFINKNLEIPKDVEIGTVYVAFVVNADGSLQDARIVRGVKDSMDQEVLKLIKNMPKWDPAIQDGKPVNAVFGLPVQFKL